MKFCKDWDREGAIDKACRLRAKKTKLNTREGRLRAGELKTSSRRDWDGRQLGKPTTGGLQAKCG